MVLLGNLDNIDWSALYHAYGSAEDIPELVRNLLDEDADIREEAQDMLYMGAFHQGTLYTCTPKLVPFFIELLQNETTLDKAWILGYLTNLITAKDWWVTNQSQLENHTQNYDLDMEEHRREQTLLANEAFTLIEQGWPLYLQFLRGKDNTIVIGATALLSLLANSVNRKLLQSEFTELIIRAESEEAKALAALCLGTIFNSAQVTVEELTFLGDLVLAEQNLTQPNKHNVTVLIQLAAAFGIIAALKTATPPAIIAKLSQILGRFPQEVTRLVDLHDSWFAYLGQKNLFTIFEELSPKDSRLLVPGLFELYTNAKQGQYYYLESMLILTFRRQALPAGTYFNNLDSLEQQLLKELGAFTFARSYYSSEFEELRLIGIKVRTKAEFKDFLHGNRPSS